MQDRTYFVYIATNKSYTLYVGITNDLLRRMEEHKEKYVNGFTKRYNIDKLLYFECFDDPYVAITREKEIKGWLRKKKINLIKTKNQQFKNLIDTR